MRLSLSITTPQSLPGGYETYRTRVVKMMFGCGLYIAGAVDPRSYTGYHTAELWT